MLSLLAILSIVAVVPLLMGAVTVGLLLSRSAGAWFSGGPVRVRVRRPPTPPPYEKQDRPGPW